MIATGEKLTIRSDPPARGHAIEFRINAEDPARGFLPVPGVVTVFDPPSGPGVRLDAGVRAGTVIGDQFDSMLAKLIVVGADRAQALARARRALAEFSVEGLPTVIGFHRAVVDDPAFAAIDGEHFTVHTRWIETEFHPRLQPHVAGTQVRPPPPRQTVVVEVGGRRLEVSVPDELFRGAGSSVQAKPRKRRERRVAAVASDAVIAPMQGTVVKVAVSEGDLVDTGDLIVVLEAMKMENPVVAHHAGTITALTARPGTPVTQGTALCRITQDPPARYGDDGVS